MHFHPPAYSDGRSLPADILAIFADLEFEAETSHRALLARQRIAAEDDDGGDDDPPPGVRQRAEPLPRMQGASLLRPHPTPQLPLATFNAATIGKRLAPARQWIVEDWLPVGRVTLFYADGGTGKTTAAQHLMTACATGKPWFGMDVTPCKSVALFCEDDAGEIHYRQDQINAFLGIAMSDLGETDWFAGIGADNVLMTFDRAGVGTTTRRFDELRERALATGARLVVIDASAGTFGGNEIDRPQVSKFVGQALTRLAMDINGAVLLLAHPSKSGMAAGGSKDSGSTAWNNSARSRWSFVRPVVDGVEDEDSRVLTREKANWSRRGVGIKVRWTDGVFVPVALLGSAPDGLARRSAEAVFLDLLAACDAAGLPVSASANAANHAGKVFAKRPDAQGFNRRQFDTAMHSLIAGEKVHNVPYGPASQGRHRLALKPEDGAE